MSRVVSCSQCSAEQRVIRQEVRRNERRLAKGLPADLAAIEASKATIAACTARGHHDDTAGARARWSS